MQIFGLPLLQNIEYVRPVTGLYTSTVMLPPPLAKYVSLTFRAKGHDVLGPTDMPEPQEVVPATGAEDRSVEDRSLPVAVVRSLRFDLLISRLSCCISCRRCSSWRASRAASCLAR